MLTSGPGYVVRLGPDISFAVTERSMALASPSEPEAAGPPDASEGIIIKPGRIPTYTKYANFGGLVQRSLLHFGFQISEYQPRD
jgi:hypothetical protein